MERPSIMSKKLASILLDLQVHYPGAGQPCQTATCALRALNCKAEHLTLYNIEQYSLRTEGCSEEQHIIRTESYPKSNRPQTFQTHMSGAPCSWMALPKLGNKPCLGWLSELGLAPHLDMVLLNRRSAR